MKYTFIIAFSFCLPITAMQVAKYAALSKIIASEENASRPVINPLHAVLPYSYTHEGRKITDATSLIFNVNQKCHINVPQKTPFAVAIPAKEWITIASLPSSIRQITCLRYFSRQYKQPYHVFIYEIPNKENPEPIRFSSGKAESSFDITVSVQ